MSLNKTRGEIHFINTTLHHYYSILSLSVKSCYLRQMAGQTFSQCFYTHHPPAPNSRGGHAGVAQKALRWGFTWNPSQFLYIPWVHICLLFVKIKLTRRLSDVYLTFTNPSWRVTDLDYHQKTVPFIKEMLYLSTEGVQSIFLARTVKSFDQVFVTVIQAEIFTGSLGENGGASEI